MKIQLIAHTIIDDGFKGSMALDAMIAAGYTFQYPQPFDADELAEFAGRNCYQSWDRPNEKTATNAGYLANILTQQHYSVLEHASATFLISGVSRSLTHELVRHRHLSFSQLSQRYVDEGQATIVVPPVIRDLPHGDIRTAIIERLSLVDQMTKRVYGEINDLLGEAGLTRKESRGAARSVLPSMTETVIVVSGNLRAWMEMLLKRRSPAADQEIRELAEEIYQQLCTIAPHTLQNM